MNLFARAAKSRFRTALTVLLFAYILQLACAARIFGQTFDRPPQDKDFVAGSRTDIGVRSHNGVNLFARRDWVISGESIQARIKELKIIADKITLIKPNGSELKVDVQDLDDVDKTYLEKLDRQSKLFVFDLETGKLVAEREVNSGDSRPLAFSPDNKTLVASHRFEIHARIFFWEIDQARKKLEYQKGWSSIQMPEFGAFLKSNELVLSGSMNIVVFDPIRNKALKATTGRSVPSVVGGAGFAIDTRLDFSVIKLDKASRSKVNSSRNSLEWSGNTAMTANGRLLVACRKLNTKIVDLHNGKTLVEMSNFSQFSTPRFVNNKYLIVDN